MSTNPDPSGTLADLIAQRRARGPLHRYDAYDDPSDDSPQERARRRAQTRFKRAIDRASTPGQIEAATERLQADLTRARSLADT